MSTCPEVVIDSFSTLNTKTHDKKNELPVLGLCLCKLPVKFEEVSTGFEFVF